MQRKREMNGRDLSSDGCLFVRRSVLREEPCTDPYARFCGQTGASASSDPIPLLAVGCTHLEANIFTQIPFVLSALTECAMEKTHHALSFYSIASAISPLVLRYWVQNVSLTPVHQHHKLHTISVLHHFDSDS